MDMSFYTAAVGAWQQQQRLDIHANNIANVNTPGYRARISSFSSLMNRELQGVDEDIRRGAGAKVQQDELDFRFVGLNNTGNSLNFSITGEGFFALLDPATGEISYTRDGTFILTNVLSAEDVANWEPGMSGTWRLSDASGRYVLGRDGAPIDVTTTGTADLTGVDFGIGVFDFINHNGFLSASQNRHYPVEKNRQVMIGTGKVVQGALELSNTDLAYEISKVIETQRSFQSLLRMVTTSDEVETTVTNLR